MMHVSLIQPFFKNLNSKSLKFAKLQKKHDPPMSTTLACLANVHCLCVPSLP